MLKHFLIMVLMLLASSLIVHAEDPTESQPIIAVSKGDIYAINPVDGSIKQLTHHPSISGGASPYSQHDLSMSTDGQYLAYLQTPPFFAMAMKNNLTDNSDAPADTVILNLSTGEEQVIARQQPNVTYKDQPRLWYRSALAWSPDGNMLMFVQYRGIPNSASFEAQVIVYSLANNTSRVLVELETYASKIAWLDNTRVVAGRGVYDLDGNLISEFYLNSGMTGRYLTHYQGRDYVIVDSADVIPHKGRVYVMDMLTGEYGVVEGIQSSISAVSPENSLVFVEDDNDTRPAYVVNLQTGGVFIPPRQAPWAVDFTFAPDGRRFAYILLDTSVNISDLIGNEVVVPFDADTILWSAKQYTIASFAGDQSAPVNPTDDFYNTKRCGTLAPVGLDAGGQGKVIVGSGANRIRKTPSVDAELIGQIPEGATFMVVNGQQGVCRDGIRWAQVEYQDVTGWTAEGADGQAFLEVVQ